MAQGFIQEDVSVRVEEIIRTQVGSDTDLSSETHLQDELGMDSLELVELGVALEKAFRLELPDADVRRCATVDDIVHLVLRAESEQR